jgi:stage II sporulation protein AA (anti-sigma F factor antagonist)
MPAEVPDCPQPERSERCVAPGEFTVISERDGEVHCALLVGELDLTTVEELDRELRRAESTDVRSIVLDLSRLTFIDSTGVQLLMTAHARSRADSNRLRLLRGPPAVQRVLQICALEDRLPFAD